MLTIKIRFSLIRKLLFLVIYAIILAGCSSRDEFDIHISKYPDGKDFAFTITEDPDYSKMEDRIIMYDFIESLGLKTTIATWVLPNKHGSGKNGVATNTRGLTTENERYLKLLKDLQRKGFEICLHTAGPGNDLREETIKGYELFKKHFGDYPKMNINHATNLEDIYWGKERFSNRVAKFIYGLQSETFEGHDIDSKYFWGDLCKEKTKYVRGWATNNINTLSVNKTLPYHLNDKPYVDWWFGCSDGYNCAKFNTLISDSNIERLTKERGTCIAYTHFAYGFIDKNGKVNNYFQKQMEKIAKKNGWFVPASEILDRFLLLRNVEIKKCGSIAYLYNKNAELISNVTIITNEKQIYDFNGRNWIWANEQGEIIIGDLQPHSIRKISKLSEENLFVEPKYFEKVKMVVEWLRGR